MERRRRFDWDDANTNHIALHGVSRLEAEQVFANSLDFSADVVEGEERVTSVGYTGRGRFLVLVTTERHNRIRVVTAFAAAKPLIGEYLRRKRFGE